MADIITNRLIINNIKALSTLFKSPVGGFVGSGVAGDTVAGDSVAGDSVIIVSVGSGVSVGATVGVTAVGLSVGVGVGLTGFGQHSAKATIQITSIAIIIVTIIIILLPDFFGGFVFIKASL